jgi:long-chain acyl-CoA synthetase
MKTISKSLPLFDVTFIDSIQDMLIKSAESYSNKLALEDIINYPIFKTTYSELKDYTLKFGRSLQKIGIKPREHIALIGENRVQWAIAFLSAMMFDFVIVPVDKNLIHTDVFNIIHDSDAAVLIFSGSFKELFQYKKELLSKVKFYICMDTEKKENDIYSMVEMINDSKDDNVEIPKININEVSEIVYTSGSLGRSKGVMLSQRNIASNLVAMRKMIKIYPEDRFLGVLPMHHTYQCTCGFLCPLYSGASLHFARSLKAIPDDLIKIKPTIMLGAPLLYNKIYNKINKTISAKRITSLVFNSMMKVSVFTEKMGWRKSKKLIFGKIHKILGGSMRLLIAGGAAPDPKVSKFFRDVGFNVVQGYGLTETSPILTLNRIEHFKDESAGLPLDGVEIKVNQPDKKGVGEIYSRGANSMLGYYKNEKATEETFQNDWFKTGDLGYFDEDGFLYISGRKKNVIIANNGENVYPEEIEDILNRNHFVLECLVFAEKDEKHNERISALIVPDTPSFIEYSSNHNIQITPEAVDKFIAQAVKETNNQLAQFKQIKKFYIRENELEKTTTQKIKRHLAIKVE